MKILIIGQGLAGSVLGITLLDRGHDIMIVDDDEPITSSKVAAGLFNPVTGMNRNKTWKAEELFPFLKKFYSQLQLRVGGSFYFEMPLYMPFATVESQNEWMSKSGESYWKQWIRISDKDEAFNKVVKNPYGAMETLQSGWVDTPILLKKVGEYLNSLGMRKSAKVLPEHVHISGEIKYEGTIYDKVIYCNGIAAGVDPMFSWLNHAHVKGDMFEVSIPQFPITHVVNKNGFILPLQNSNFRVGSTYNNSFDDPVSVTKQGFEELKNKLDNIVQTNYQIIRHYAATRPATKDRKPLLGKHPKYNNILIFNGLGTKGVSLAPYLANHLADFLEGKAELMPEVDIQRCAKFFKIEHQNV